MPSWFLVCISTVHAGSVFNQAPQRSPALAFDIACMGANLRRVRGKRALRAMGLQAYGQVPHINVLDDVDGICGTLIIRFTADRQRSLSLTKCQKSPRVRGERALF